ncbi:MAG: glycolate oxidase subunit GlcE [Gammaproteobacteria bacterium]|nr:glycolate oxidase subunit GlcE [Gammaproteobacteria bacterium]
MNNLTNDLQAQILAAYKNKTHCRIEGGNSKAFIGNAPPDSQASINISTAEHTGIISYDASELVITARSGTTLHEIKQALAENNQSLPFEPPSFADSATIGGTIACNLSGPARAYSGAARDFVLGSRIINGKGDDMQFGGQVMKNVAGYDASRLMAGAYGTLGLILEVSLKVLPLAQTEITIKSQQHINSAIKNINALSAQNWPISASVYLDGHLYIRLNSSEMNCLSASQAISQKINATEIADSKAFWTSITEQQHAFFDTSQSIARLSLPATAEDIEPGGEQLIEWGGALRWLKTDLPIQQLRDTARTLGGHVTAYKNYPQATEYFQPLAPGMHSLHQRLNKAFDPAGILNPGRLYKEL